MHNSCTNTIESEIKEIAKGRNGKMHKTLRFNWIPSYTHSNPQRTMPYNKAACEALWENRRISDVKYSLRGLCFRKDWTSTISCTACCVCFRRVHHPLSSFPDCQRPKIYIQREIMVGGGVGSVRCLCSVCVCVQCHRRAATKLYYLIWQRERRAQRKRMSSNVGAWPAGAIPHQIWLASA